MRTLLITILFVFAGFPLLSQQELVPSYEETLAEYEDLFSAEEPLYLTLKFDVNAFKKARRQDVYHEAEMTKVVSDDVQVSESVQVRATGTFRRDFCALPPISLNIGNSGIKTDSLQDEFQMNMVLPCKNAAQYEPYVLREYLAYKIYNIITPLSYQVRLVRLTIIDSGKGNEVIEDWAFLQEPNNMMAERNQAVIVDSEKLSLRTVNKEIMDKVAFFSYMIGQGDYSVTGQHNLKILALKEYGPTGFIPVPFQFDFSGLVNADYAVPAEALGTTSVRERYYLGACRDEETHRSTINWLASYHDDIVELIKDFEYLDDKEKLDMIEYLDSYFKESKESGFIDHKIAPTCR